MLDQVASSPRFTARIIKLFHFLEKISVYIKTDES
jgi:hypothetical protein